MSDTDDKESNKDLNSPKDETVQIAPDSLAPVSMNTQTTKTEAKAIAESKVTKGKNQYAAPQLQWYEKYENNTNTLFCLNC